MLPTYCSSSQGRIPLTSKSMKANKKKPFTISRQPHKMPLSNASKSGSLDSEMRALVPIARKDPQLELQNQILATQTVYKNCYNLFKVSPSQLPDLMQKYAEDNYTYRDEEFTQQADNFLAKIATGKKIPKDLKANYPLYHILVSICKIFMLNEYEIVVLGCALDNCNWKIEETVFPEEADLLKEFPGNLGDDIDTECKRLIIYLLVITFSLKQYLNEKGEADKIHAYCESICINFQAIFNRWTRVSSYHRFSYSPVEINRKFRSLCQKETFDPVSSLNKDYNTVVESIMGLTGPHRPKLNTMPMLPAQPGLQPTSIFHKFTLPPPAEIRSAFPELLTPAIMPVETIERGSSKPPKQIDLTNSVEGYEVPMLESFSRRSSSSNLFAEELGKNKRIKSNTPGLSLFRESSLFRDFPSLLSNSMKNCEPEEFLINSLAMPILSKRSSFMSQMMPEETPNLFKFSSSLFNKDHF